MSNPTKILILTRWEHTHAAHHHCHSMSNTCHEKHASNVIAPKVIRSRLNASIKLTGQPKNKKVRQHRDITQTFNLFDVIPYITFLYCFIRSFMRVHSSIRSSPIGFITHKSDHDRWSFYYYHD